MTNHTENEHKTFEERFDMLMQYFEKSCEESEKRAAEYEKAREQSNAEWKARAAEYEKAREQSNAEYEKAREKSNAEFEKRLAAFDKRMEKIQSNIGGISDSNGAMTEEAIYNILEKDKTFANVKFDELYQKVPVMSGFKTKTELDFLMVNGDTISIIEAKYKVEKKDINNILHKKLTYFRECCPQYNNYKIILGIGGMSFEDKAITEAQNNGVGIIKIVGDKVEYYTEKIKIY